MKRLVIHPEDKSTDFLKPIYHGRSDTTVITGGCEKADVEDAIKSHDHIIMLGHGTPQGLLAMGKFNRKYTPAVKPSTAIRSFANGGPIEQEHIKSFYHPDPTVQDDLPLLSLPSSEDDWFADRQVGAYSSYASAPITGNVIDDDTADLLRTKKLTAIWCNADQYMEWNELDGFYTGMFISDEGEARMIGTADTDKWQVEESNYGFVEVVRRHLDQEDAILHSAIMRFYGPMAERNSVAKYNLKRIYAHKNSQCARKAEVA